MSVINKKPTVIELTNVCKSFKKDRQQELLVLKNINIRIKEGEMVALLGKSGSGKSTLLRIIAGLLSASSGKVAYAGAPVTGPVRGVSMVFQHFALMPWLTVLQNVELGLEALGVDAQERRKRALKAIDTIGLDGFESAYPKELSGGMRQRVGFARALVVDPDVLLMDEPFSALDVLTADNLKSDLLDLWHGRKTRTRAILFVTHSIEEAIYMADRVIVFDSDPGEIKGKLVNGLAHPRSEGDPEFRALVDEVYTLMTRKERKQAYSRVEAERAIDMYYRLPEVSVNELAGMLETINEPERQGKMDLPELSEYLNLDIDDLFPLTEVLEILRFARVSEGDITLTPAGKGFSEADILVRKQLFAKHLVDHVPLAKHIREVLDGKSKHRISDEYFLDELEQELSDKEAERVLKVAIDWGRYAELFAYDVNAHELSLENPD